jgi:hypothetical protein
VSGGPRGSSAASCVAAHVSKLAFVSSTFKLIRELVAAGNVRVPEYGYDELSEDGIRVRDVLSGVSGASVVEDYPEFGKGPVVLGYSLIQ